MPNIVILGEGSREYAIKYFLKNHHIDMVPDKKSLFDLIKSKSIDLVIIGSEIHLVDGIVDKLEVPCFGPSKAAAEIEGSKLFSKKFMITNNIPTSPYKYFNKKFKIYDFLRLNFGNKKYVIKKPGLEGGKGVFMPETLEETGKYLRTFTGEAIVEERVYGREVSVMGFCNGYDIELMPQISDFKRINDGDKGPNTGGMGAIGPVDILTFEDIENIKIDMLKVVRELNFKGVLYAGIMKTNDGYSILEFNCRFGDPETQVALNLLDSDLFDIMINCINGKPLEVKWKNMFCANVVLSHIDYPETNPYKPIYIDIGTVDDDIKIYWANITMIRNVRYTYGGRVASMVHLSDNLQNSLEHIYNNIHKINYEGRYYRRDIGLKYLLDHQNKRPLRIGILGSEKGTSIQNLLNEMDEINVRVEVIVSNKPSGILKKGNEKNIASIFLPTFKNKEKYYNILANILNNFDLDLVFAVGFMNIFPPSFCYQFKGKLYNIHPSLLPDHKGLCGMKVHKKVILDKNKISGCTLHEISEVVDSGKIVMQKQYRLKENETPDTLKIEIQKLESQTIIDYIILCQNKSITYKDSGVDVNEGNKFTDIIKNETIGSFCGIYKVGGRTFGASTDGTGTKLEIANEYNRLENIGIDLVAMCVNDLIVRGIKPKFFLDYIAMDKLDSSKSLAIIESIKKGCQISGSELLGGETAEMPGIYKNNCFDLSGCSVGLLEGDLYPKIDEIEKGCKIYGLGSNGFHSNGYSLIRKLLKYDNYDIETLLKPTKIYMECFEIIEKYKDSLLGMSHITGGGLIDNIKRIIPNHFNLKLDIEIKDEFLWAMEKSGLSYNEMIRTFNCGYGIALIFRKGVIIDEFDEIGKVI